MPLRIWIEGHFRVWSNVKADINGEPDMPRTFYYKPTRVPLKDMLQEIDLKPG